MAQLPNSKLDTAIVLPTEAGEPFLLRRTLRTLSHLGARATVAREVTAVRDALQSGARWMVRAGAFGFALPSPIHPSCTGLPVFALGFRRDRLPEAHRSADLSACGSEPLLRQFATAAVDDRAARLLCEGPRCAQSSIDELLGSWWSSGRVRLFHGAALDAQQDDRVRVAQVVTSAQIGGAEKIAHVLASALPRYGLSSRLFALGRPTRTRLPLLDTEWRLYEHSRGGPAIAPLTKELARWGANLVHGHLLDADTIERLAAAGFAPVLTIHNSREGWPTGTVNLSRATSPLVLGCGRAIAEQLRAAGVQAPIRSVANGVATAFRRGSPDSRQEAEAIDRLRSELHPSRDAIALLFVANPRPQKRFDRVPEIAAALERLAGRPVVVVWAGQPSLHDDSAHDIAASLRVALAARRIPLVALGSRLDMPIVYRSCDVLLNVSDWEGLALSQLEALAAGLPIVVSAVGEAPHLSDCPGVRILPKDSEPEAFARALSQALASDEPTPTLPLRWGEEAMSAQYARHLRCVARRPSTGRPKQRVLLITNNFSPGGAQSSARRLILGLQARVDIHALVLQECASPSSMQAPVPPAEGREGASPESELTPGTRALREAGVPVLTCHEPGRPWQATIERALDLAVDVGATHVVFWNALAEAKALMAESLHDAMLFDVSPGEMFYRSMVRYFEKPREDCSLRSLSDYGRRLHGMAVKYHAEAALAERLLGCPVRVMPNGVPIVATPRAPERARAGRGGTFRWGTTVRIHPDKKLEELLTAFAELVGRGASRGVSDGARAVELEILGMADAGSEDYAQSLRERTANLPIRWLGFADDPRPYLDGWDGFVLVAEPAGCPNSTLEALGAGLPVVATDVGGISEQLADGAGMVVARSDPMALARTMARVTDDGALAHALALRGQARARQHFSVEAMCERYADWWGLR